MKTRSPVMVIVLTMVTCGIYWFYWNYATTSELKEASGSEELKPGLELFLALVTCGLFSLYTEYRNAQLLHTMISAHEPDHKDNSQTVLLLNLCSLITGMTWLIAVYIVQEELNKAAQLPARLA